MFNNDVENYSPINIKANSQEIDIQSWSEFNNAHPNGNIFQSPEYYRVCEKSNVREPIVVIAEQNGDIVGILMGVLQKENLKFFSNLTTRTVIWGGPLADNDEEEIKKCLLNTFNRIVSKKSIYTQIRNLKTYSENELELFQECGFDFEDHLGITINLELDLDELWSAMQSQGRRNIKKARKSKLEFGFVDSEKQYWEGVRIVKSLYDYLGLPLPDKAYFQALFDEMIPQNKLKVFGAFYEGKLIGVLFGFCYNGMIFEWYTGSDSSYLNKRPNDFLIWKVIEYGKENNFKVFDMGGAGKPDEEYGVRDHKLKFGGELFHFGRFSNVHKPLLYNLGKFGVKHWDTIKKYLGK